MLFINYTHCRIVISPLYTLAMYFTWKRLSEHRGGIWILGYCLACIITLVPTPLLEPRYFTPGVILYLLHMPQVHGNVRYCTIWYACVFLPLITSNTILLTLMFRLVLESPVKQSYCALRLIWLQYSCFCTVHSYGRTDLSLALCISGLN